jgi:hypothetical protein
MVAGIGKRGFVVNPRSLSLTAASSDTFRMLRHHFSETALGTLTDFLTQGKESLVVNSIPGCRRDLRPQPI